MGTPHNDPPRERVRPAPEAHAFIVESALLGREVEVRRAKSFAAVDAGHHYLMFGCAGIAEYGLRFGYGSFQARDYAAAGHVMARCPDAEAMLLDGSMSIASLAIIAPLFLDSDLRPCNDQAEPVSNEEILKWALLRSDVDLRRYMRRHRREVEAGQRTTRETVHLTPQGAHDLDRTQVLESRKQRRAVSRSEAVEVALRAFVVQNDLLEKAPGTRRLPAMPERADGTRNSRTIPAEVARALMQRHGDVCAIDCCDNRIWLDNSHHTAHAAGGGNELEDQHRLCKRHHRMKDHREIRWVPDDRCTSGGHYETQDGIVLPLKAVDLAPGADPPGASSIPPDMLRERAPPYNATGYHGMTPRVRLLTSSRHAALHLPLAAG